VAYNGGSHSAKTNLFVANLYQCVIVAYPEPLVAVADLDQQSNLGLILWILAIAAAEDMVYSEKARSVGSKG
jgi:hypothetical protein